MDDVVVMDFDDDAQPPDILPRQISRFALETLEKFEWIHLWYFTRAGILDAAASSSGVPENSLNLRQTDNGYVIDYEKAAKPSRNVVKDEDLEWPEIMEARHNLLEAVANWPMKNRMALASFFVQLEKLKSFGSSDKALVIYQARIRRLWHAGLKGRAKPFNIGNINMSTLASIENDVRDDKQIALEKKASTVHHLT